jgi:hypothetical protein
LNFQPINVASMSMSAVRFRASERTSLEQSRTV